MGKAVYQEQDHREKPVILFLDKRIVIFFKRLGHSVSG